MILKGLRPFRTFIRQFIVCRANFMYILNSLARARFLQSLKRSPCSAANMSSGGAAAELRISCVDCADELKEELLACLDAWLINVANIFWVVWLFRGTVLFIFWVFGYMTIHLWATRIPICCSLIHAMLRTWFMVRNCWHAEGASRMVFAPW
jgi:hypothetical protein